MELHEIISVAEANEAGVYVANIDLTDMTGERYTCDYVVRPDDNFGLAPVVRDAVSQWIADGRSVDPYTPPPPPEPEPPTVEDYRAAIQNMLDDAARAKLYDSGLSLSTYVNSTNPVWAAEAAAFVAWRDAVWAYAYTELAKVEAELRPIPTVEEFLSELPEIVWPEGV